MAASTRAAQEQPDDPFAPVVVRSAAAQVADRVVGAIRDGRLGLDSRLPAERELAQRLGVSRPTLREALAALELAGVIQSRQGRGTTVIASAAQVANWGAEILPTQVFEARLAIEPELAALAATKRYPEDIERLRAAGAEVDAEFARTGHYGSDLGVHRAIARAARNPLLEQALADALKHTESARWKSLRSRALAPERARQGHVSEVRQVIEHIARGEAAEASRIWREHLEFFRDEMLDGLKETGG